MMGSFKVIAKTGIEIVAELGPYHDFDEARGDAQELADKMVDAAQVYVLDEMAQAELGVGGPVPFSQAPELQLEETALALVPEANPQESLGSRWGRNPTENPAYLAYHAAPGEIKRQLKEAARLVDQGDLRGADSLIRSSGASRADLWWILGNERLAQLHEWADPVVARHPHPEKAAWPSERARWRHPPGKYERNPHGGGSLDEAIATAEYVVKDATEAGQLAFGMGDTEGAGKYVRQVEKAKRDLSKLQAARHSVGHRSYLGSTEGRGRYGAERRWRQRMGREAAEVIAAQRAGGRYVNPKADRVEYPWYVIEKVYGMKDRAGRGGGYILTPRYSIPGTRFASNQSSSPFRTLDAAKEAGVAYEQEIIDLPRGHKPNPEQWLQEADEEIEAAGTEGAFTKQARRAGYKDTMVFARAVMKGWRSGRKTVKNKKTGRMQGVTKKTMNRANFAINAQKRRRNPPKKNSFLTDDQFEAKYGVRPGDRFTDEHGEWVVDYAESYITDPPIVTIYRADRGKGHAISMGVSRLLDPHFFAQKRRRNPAGPGVQALNAIVAASLAARRTGRGFQFPAPPRGPDPHTQAFDDWAADLAENALEAGVSDPSVRTALQVIIGARDAGAEGDVFPGGPTPDEAWHIWAAKVAINAQKRRRNPEFEPFTVHKMVKTYGIILGDDRYAGRKVMAGFKTKKAANQAVAALSDARWDHKEGRKREYHTQGRYGYTAVDVFEPGEPYSPIRTAISGLTKKVANDFAITLRSANAGYYSRPLRNPEQWLQEADARPLRRRFRNPKAAHPKFEGASDAEIASEENRDLSIRQLAFRYGKTVQEIKDILDANALAHGGRPYPPGKYERNPLGIPYPERYLSADQERLLDEVVLTAENYGHHYPSDPAKAVDEAIRTIKDYREVGLDEDMTEIRSFAIRRVQAEWRRHNAHGAD